MANAWVLPPAGGVAVDVSSLSAGAALHVLNDYAGLAWVSGTGTQHAIRVDLGGDAQVNTAMLFGVAAAPTSLLTVTCQDTAGNIYNSPPTALFAGTSRLWSGYGVSIWTAPAGMPPVRFMRYQFDLPASGTVRISRVIAGSRTSFGRNFSFGGGFGARDLGSVDWTRRGVLLRKPGRKLRTAALTFSSLRRDEIDNVIAAIVELYGNTTPIALVTDPTLGGLVEQRSYYGPLVGDLSAASVWRTAAAWEWKANIVSLF